MGLHEADGGVGRAFEHEPLWAQAPKGAAKIEDHAGESGGADEERVRFEYQGLRESRRSRAQSSLLEHHSGTPFHEACRAQSATIRALFALPRPGRAIERPLPDACPTLCPIALSTVGP